jgi:hypothetical protein
MSGKMALRCTREYFTYLKTWSSKKIEWRIMENKVEKEKIGKEESEEEEIEEGLFGLENSSAEHCSVAARREIFLSDVTVTATRFLSHHGR